MRRLVTGFLLTLAIFAGGSKAFADNQAVADRIAANLRDSGQLRNYRIEVRVADGIATLEGTVASIEQMNTALGIAARTEGVSRVINRLKVGPVETAVPTQEQTPPRIMTFGSPPAQKLQVEINAPAEDQTPVVPVSAPSPPRVLLPAPMQVELAPPAEQTTSQMPQPQGHSNTILAQGPAAIIMVPTAAALGNRPLPVAYIQPTGPVSGGGYVMPVAAGPAPMVYNQPYLPKYAWPSYAPYPNYASLTYPRQYSPTAWPYIGPFYPYPQVPLGWRRVTLEWHDGWWFLDFDDGSRSKGLLSGLLHPLR